MCSAFAADIDQYPGYDKPRGYQLCLGGMKPKDVVFAVDPDILDKETLDTVEDQVEPKESAGYGQAFAKRPEDKEQHQAGQGLIERSRKNGDRQLAAILTITTGDPGSFADDVVRIRIGKKPVREKGRRLDREMRYFVETAELRQIDFFVLLGNTFKITRICKRGLAFRS